MSHKGSLVVVGTGYQPAIQTTPEALVHIRTANKLFHLVDVVTARWLEKLNASAVSLSDCYAPGKDRGKSYAEMVRRVLKPVRGGLNVCMALYGHPGVFVNPSHEAIRRARAEGYSAVMLPGISAEDCLFADLAIDPACGCQTFSATNFLLRRRSIDTSSPLVLWQIGLVGVWTYKRQHKNWSARNLRILIEHLEKHYGSTHEVVVYEAPKFPMCKPLIQRVRLGLLATAKVTMSSTLYVPAVR